MAIAVLAFFSSIHSSSAAAASSSITTLRWNVTATNNQNEKFILRDVFGSARIGKIHALLG